MSSEKKVTSLKKVLANQQNAKNSTGPRTENGKAWAKRNVIKHGLLAENIVTIGENKQVFEEFNQQMLKELQPIDMFSMQIVNKIIQTAWNFKFKVGCMLMKSKAMKEMIIKANCKPFVMLTLRKKMKRAFVIKTCY